MNLLNKGDTIGICGLSNPMGENATNVLTELFDYLNTLGLNCVYDYDLLTDKNLNEDSFRAKGEYLNKLFKEPSIKAIFDITGGDLANTTLPYINFDMIKDNKKPFFAYSDLSVIINPLIKKADINCFYYQIRNLVGDSKVKQRELFENMINSKANNLTEYNYKFLRGEFAEGILIGGNIRCLLKLAGTEFMPDFNDKILFLESLGGNKDKIYTFLMQYKLLGILDSVGAIVLGQFTELDREDIATIEEIILSFTKTSNIPIIRTQDIGHSSNAKAMRIGSFETFKI